MGANESVIDSEIRALTQLVSSYVQKRSFLNYQINQLKLAQNTKKTCIETKKLRDLKVKNANLVVEIENSQKLLKKIKQKKFISAKDKNLAKYVTNFKTLLEKKSRDFERHSNDMAEKVLRLNERKLFVEDRKKFLGHLQEKVKKNKEKISKSAEILEKCDKLGLELKELRMEHELSLQKKKSITEKHAKLAQRRKLKRRQTLVIPRLTQNAFMLRSKLLLKAELLKQLNELKADQTLHFEQQNKLQINISLAKEEEEDLDTLRKLNTSKEFLQSKIFRYKSELELVQNSPATPISAFMPLREIEDSLHTDFDCTSESPVHF